MMQSLPWSRLGRLIQALPVVFVMAACSSAPPAPIQNRTSPTGTVSAPRPPVATAPAAPIVTPAPAPVVPRVPQPASVESVPLRPSSVETRPIETRPLEPRAPASGAVAPAPSAATAPSSGGALASPPASLSPATPSSLSSTTPSALPPAAPLTRSEPRGTKQPYSDSALAEMRSAPVAPTAGAAASGAAPGASTATAAAPATTAPAAGGATAATTPAARAADPDWGWPTNGRIVQSFAESSKGIALAGAPGDAVAAAAEGRVIFSGNGPRGYGNLVIVKHANDLLSVYAHNRTLLVKEGQTVKRGQKIAELGETGGATPRLHFEIRQQGKPIDPTTVLPRR